MNDTEKRIKEIQKRCDTLRGTLKIHKTYVSNPDPVEQMALDREFLFDELKKHCKDTDDPTDFCPLCDAEAQVERYRKMLHGAEKNIESLTDELELVKEERDKWLNEVKELLPLAKAGLDAAIILNKDKK